MYDNTPGASRSNEFRAAAKELSKSTYELRDAVKELQKEFHESIDSLNNSLNTLTDFLKIQNAMRERSIDNTNNTLNDFLNIQNPMRERCEGQGFKLTRSDIIFPTDIPTFPPPLRLVGLLLALSPAKLPLRIPVFLGAWGSPERA